MAEQSESVQGYLEMSTADSSIASLRPPLAASADEESFLTTLHERTASDASSVGQDTSATVCVQRNLIKQLQQLVRQQASTIENLHGEVQKSQQGTRETDLLYLERLKSQQDRLEDRQSELHGVRKEAEMFRKEIEHLRGMMSGLETEANERERMYSQMYSNEKQKVDRDRWRQAELLERVEHEKGQLITQQSMLRSTVAELEGEVARLRLSLAEEQRTRQSAEREAEAAKQARVQLLEELKRETQETQDREEKHRRELEEREVWAARAEQERQGERVRLGGAMSELEMERSVLQNQVTRLEMQLLDRMAGEASPSVGQGPLPNSAVVVQLARSEEEVNRLRVALEGAEEQRRMDHAQVGEAKARAEMHRSEARRALEALAEVREARQALEKGVKGLRAEGEAVKEDLARARERCAELERGLLDFRVEWQRDKAALVDEAQDVAQRCRTLEQELRERTHEAEMRQREVQKLEATHSDLNHKYTKLSTSKSEAVSELAASMAASEDSRRQEQAVMESELHELRQKVRELDEELGCVKAQSRAQADKAGKLSEQQRREVHDANLELGRLRVRLEERQWSVQKLEGALEAVQHKGKADKDVTQHLRESLSAAGKEIEKLRRERDALVKEGRETEERLQADVDRLQARVEEGERARREGRRRRAESALASLGEQVTVGKGQQRDEGQGEGEGEEEEDAGDCQSDDGAERAEQWSTPTNGNTTNPWHSVARLLGEGMGMDPGGRAGSRPSSSLLNGRPGGLGSGESQEYRLRDAQVPQGYVDTHAASGMLQILGDYERGGVGVGQRRQRLASSEPLASVCVRGGRVPSAQAQGPRSIDPTTSLRAVSRGGLGTRGGKRPQSVSMRMDREGGRRGDGGQEEEEEGGLGSGHHAFGCWDGPQSGDTDDSFVCAQADHSAPPLAPPVPPLPSLSSPAQQPVRHRRREGEAEEEDGQASLASRRSRKWVDMAEGPVQQKTAKTRRKPLPHGKGQVPLVPANTLTAARLRQAVSGAANAGKAMRRAASLSQSSNGSIGRLTPRSVSSHTSGPKAGVKPLTAAAQRRNSAALSVPRALTRHRERYRLPKVHV